MHVTSFITQLATLGLAPSARIAHGQSRKTNNKSQIMKKKVSKITIGNFSCVIINNKEQQTSTDFRTHSFEEFVSMCS